MTRLEHGDTLPAIMADKPSLAKWWAEHKQHDEHRLQREAEQRREQNIRDAARAADGCVVGANCTIWHPKHGACVCRSDVDSGCWAMTSDPHHPASGELILVEECYSTEQAAREANEEGK